MSEQNQNDYAKRYQQKSAHLFDFGLYNVYDNNIINLSVGAPGPDLLSNCCEIFNEATKHRLVCLSDPILYAVERFKKIINLMNGTCHFRVLSWIAGQHCFNMDRLLGGMTLEIRLLSILQQNTKIKSMGKS